jgi:hypothetical protein
MRHQSTAAPLAAATVANPTTIASTVGRDHALAWPCGGLRGAVDGSLDAGRGIAGLTVALVLGSESAG